MKKYDVSNNGLKLNDYDFEKIIPHGFFNAVFSRAGVGKTSFIVQVALNAMLKQKNVLHIAIGDPVNKISLWYKEIFYLLAERNKIKEKGFLFESLLKKRFIMTFNVDAFSVPRLTERLSDLSEQDIFTPEMIIIDGLDFNGSVRESIEEIKKFAEKIPLETWFTVRTHRHEDPGHGLLPIQLSNIENFFDVLIQLSPEGKKIHVFTLKGKKTDENYEIVVDPSTMLIKIDE